MLTHRFFWPDRAPYGILLRTLGRELVKAGHDVQIFSARPSHNEVSLNSSVRSEFLDGFQVTRCFVLRDEKRNIFIRMFNILMYCTLLLYQILRKRPQIVCASTYPPVLAAALACFASRIIGARFIYHVQDIHPEISKLVGDTIGSGILYQTLLWIDNRTLKNSSAVITLSSDMATTLKKRGVEIQRLVICDNFSIEDFTGCSKGEREELNETYQVIFAGNLGRFQDLELLTDGLALCFDKNPQLRLVLMGTGIMEDKLKKKWGAHPQVHFEPFRPFSEAKKMIAMSDLGIVSLKPGMTAVAKPSKIASYEALELPILLLGDPESTMALELVEQGNTVLVRERTPLGVSRALSIAISSPRLQENAKIVARKQDRLQKSIECWKKLIRDIT